MYLLLRYCIHVQSKLTMKNHSILYSYTFKRNKILVVVYLLRLSTYSHAQIPPTRGRVWTLLHYLRDCLQWKKNALTWYKNHSLLVWWCRQIRLHELWPETLFLDFLMCSWIMILYYPHTHRAHKYVGYQGHTLAWKLLAGIICTFFVLSNHPLFLFLVATLSPRDCLQCPKKFTNNCLFAD